jgi:hypothetical protein
MTRWLLLVVLASSSLLAQAPSGEISGLVREPDGTPATGVRVYAASLTTPGAVLMVQTDRSGLFRLQNVRSGSYCVLATALVTTIEEAGQAWPVVVHSPFLTALMAGCRFSGTGTYFPGTTDLQRAGTVTLVDGAGSANADITLAHGAYPYSDFPLRIVRGKFVVEGGGPPIFRRDELELFFSDGPGNRSATVTFLTGTATPKRAVTRLEARNPFRSLTSVVPMPVTPDGAFRLVLPDGLYRVLQPAPSTKPTSHSTSRGQYIKGMSFGTADLMKELMSVRAPEQDELVITLATCTESTQDPLCRN